MKHFYLKLLFFLFLLGQVHANDFSNCNTTQKKVIEKGIPSIVNLASKMVFTGCQDMSAQWETPTPTVLTYRYGAGWLTGVPDPSNLATFSDRKGIYERYTTPNLGTTSIEALRVGLGSLVDTNDNTTFNIVVYDDNGSGRPGALIGSEIGISPTTLGVPGLNQYGEYTIAFTTPPMPTTNSFHVGVEIIAGDATDNLVVMTSCLGPGNCAVAQGENDASNYIYTPRFGYENLRTVYGADLDAYIIPVLDNTPPTVICNNPTIQLDAAGNATITAADIDNGNTDACGIASTTIDITTFDCTNIGTNNVTLTVTDTNGNSTSCIATVTVEDTATPVIACLDATVQLDNLGNTSIMVSDFDGGSSDNCNYEVYFSNDLEISHPTHNNNNNSSGHGQSFIATITGVLNTVRIMVNRDYTNRTFHFYNGSGSGTPNNIGSPAYTETGVTLVNSNSGTIWSEITLSTPFPVIAGNTYAFVIQRRSNVYYSWFNPYPDGAFIHRYDISSGCCNWGDLAFELEFLEFNNTLDLDCDDIGIQSYDITAIDSSGNIDTCVTLVTVEDTILPNVVCQNITLQLDATGNATITATDIDNGSTDSCNIASYTLDTYNFNCSSIGTNSVTLTVTDINGNSANCTATVTVEDNMLPVANNPVLLPIYEACSLTTITPPTATDNCANTITGTTTTTFPVLVSTTIIWSFDDGNGNIVTQDQEVTIEDTFAPIPDNLSLEEINTTCILSNLPAPTGSDVCAGIVTATTATVFPITQSTLIEWTFTDGVNNSTQNQQVNIFDSTPTSYTATGITNAVGGKATIIVTATGSIYADYEIQLDNNQWVLADKNEDTFTTTFQDVFITNDGLQIINIRSIDGCWQDSLEVYLVGYLGMFTPNGDGIHDSWNVIGLSNTNPNSRVRIFNRYGKLLTQFTVSDTGWDGTYNGSRLPSSEYWFKVDYIATDTSGNQIPKTLTGHFSLLR